jgi:hypothetical protein
MLLNDDDQIAGPPRLPVGPLARGWRLASTAASTAVAWRIWQRSHARFLARQLIHRKANRERGLSDLDHVRAAAAWLAAAQDSQPDGGIAGRYHLARGWTSSYPETTGYTIPTLLALADALDDPGYVARARRCVGFLLNLQLACGAFPGMEVAHNLSEPSSFNTAQIIHGLTAWHRTHDDREVLVALRRAADWLVAVQDPDGAWRRHCYVDTAASYAAHLSCWLAELGDYLGERRYSDAAARHLDWVLARRDPTTGWFDDAGFDPDWHRARRAFTHTIAYTLAGVLTSSALLGRQDGIDAVAQAARAMARRFELSGRLPGVLDWRWRAGSNDTCLTGNAQMALVWFRLFELERDASLLSTAFKALDAVKDAQPLDNPHPGLCGGVPGSDPVWADYLYGALPNWAAKYLIDALLEKRRLLARLIVPRGARAHPAPIALAPPGADRCAAARPAIVLLSGPGGAKALRLLEAWQRWGFTPRAVVLERPAAPPAWRRLGAQVSDGGLPALARRIAARWPRRSGGGAPPRGDLAGWCRRAGVALVETGALDRPDALAAVAALAPDLLVHAGAGILRAPLLALPRLGTLNAHMGLLPGYRGVHVAEWAAFHGDPVGCTVHLIDPGIDTGDILCTGPVDVAGARTIAALRARVDDAQIALLGAVVRHVWRTGALPPRHPQRAAAGRQYFAMHPELAAVLERALGSRDQASGARDQETERAALVSS